MIDNISYLIGVAVGVGITMFLTWLARRFAEEREATQKEKTMHQEMQKQINAMSQQVDWTFHNSGFAAIKAEISNIN